MLLGCALAELCAVRSHEALACESLFKVWRILRAEAAGARALADWVSGAAAKLHALLQRLEATDSMLAVQASAPGDRRMNPQSQVARSLAVLLGLDPFKLSDAATAALSQAHRIADNFADLNNDANELLSRPLPQALGPIVTSSSVSTSSSSNLFLTSTSPEFSSIDSRVASAEERALTEAEHDADQAEALGFYEEVGTSAVRYLCSHYALTLSQIAEANEALTETLASIAAMKSDHRAFADLIIDLRSAYDVAWDTLEVCVCV